MCMKGFFRLDCIENYGAILGQILNESEHRAIENFRHKFKVNISSTYVCM
jgi:hypothetical protein